MKCASPMPSILMSMLVMRSQTLFLYCVVICILKVVLGMLGVRNTMDV